jgi:uncharacterized protein (DUF2147 family)
VYGTKLKTMSKVGSWIFHTGLQSFAALAVVCFCASAPAQANAELGTWLNTDRKGKIQLRECGDNSLCGQLVWLKDPVDKKGKPWLDELNPDPKLRTRSVVGVDVLIGTKKIAPKTWQGRIYDPEVGKVYYLKHLKVGKDKVEIKGCLPSGWPCRTKYWTRTKPINPPAPIQIAKKADAPNSIPNPMPAPRAAVAAPRVAAPASVPPAMPPVAVAPPVQPQMPNPAQQPQTRLPVPPAPAARLVAPQVTASLPRPATGLRQGGYLVQVAARQSHNEALQAYNELQRRFPRLLGQVAPEVLKADLGQRGVWYRVGVGPMEQQSAANNFCQRLKAVGADCFIRRR